PAIDDLAQYMGYSRRFVYDVFYQYGQLPIGQYIRLRHVVFMPPHARVQRLKDEIANAIERPLLPRQDPPFNRLRRCINCACRSVSDAQTKVIYAFSIGLSPHEVAAALNISPKTIHSHKKNIMSKFNLNSRQQFNNLVQLLAKR
ncbi:LuxR C-terminal-related transcriptional regulator, partial [Klebsiella pneumoniae]|uniref:helix-turn-helix transcriptional regulator n=1 Tax=Klebsiella pneumoniae TaxID=573 RepID=UPI00200E4A16